MKQISKSKLTKLHEPVGRVQFEVFEKFASTYLFQIAREKSCDYLPIINKPKFLDKQLNVCFYFALGVKLVHTLIQLFLVCCVFLFLALFFNVPVNSKTAHPPTPAQTLGHFTFLRNFGHIPRYVAS